MKATRILIIEDSDDDIFIYQRSLAKLDMETKAHYSHSIPEALAFLEGVEPKEWPDLILSDSNTGPLAPNDLLTWLKSRSKVDVPVIIVTSHNTPSKKEEYTRQGAVEIYEKPFTANWAPLMRQIINKHLASN